MKVKSVQQSDANRVRKSEMAYLEGSQTLNWVTGVIRSSGDILAAGQTLAMLHGYGSRERYKELARWFDSVTGVK